MAENWTLVEKALNNCKILSACFELSLNIGVEKQNISRGPCYLSVVYIFNFHDVGPYQKETSPLICKANQWTGFYTIQISLMKELTAIVAIFEILFLFFIGNCVAE